MKFSLRKGKRYKASVVLGIFERTVANIQLADELRKVGFTDVTVTGTGGIRYVVATWSRADQDRELPRQVHEIIEMKPVLVMPDAPLVPPPMPPDVPVRDEAPVPSPAKKPWWKVW